ncbi:AAA family ATPase [Candidatus Nomurabacteria bacterium CG_4_9_14_0_2_um_filter_32_10]|uniref:AAA family ATPase n=2 Tax=Candidatus Nomuraibacteriota TaxID=1752729 RepID=A0A2J0MII5_9BACT|nr:MAG: AAA family ATPase [Candidatus Nomurabacteria bacterium CG_4_10_14_0_2_um_filter_33_9]PJC49523.1 MAG: AAA family ATPase [Candidatus Nomurabacteria bacterium CG_4_9_14_0_2_um_filter_32_10]
MTQDEALRIMKTGANVFLTGEPGSGKTYTINKYVDYLRKHEINHAITASTGIAATHINGMTIHSWSGIGIKKTLNKYDLDRIATSEYICRRVRKTKILIIDEISMLRAETLSMVDSVCREIRQNSEPFGGIQVILVGDFFQLPPIERNNMEQKQESLLEEKQGRFAYESSVWKHLSLVVCYISEQYRQDDASFLELLLAIRHDTVLDEHRDKIKSRYVIDNKFPENITKIFSYNLDVDKVNDGMLLKIEGENVKFNMESNGSLPLITALKKGCLSPEVLVLKKGAVVMCTKNNQKEHFVNGTLGIVVDFESFSKHPIIKTKNGRNIVITPMDWTIEENGKIKAKITQIPLRLAWAMTVHKSQGMSMDAAVMDLSSVFEYGQGYVALSRVRRLDGLYLLGCNEHALKVHPQILKQDSFFKKESENAQKTFGAISTEKIKKMHKNFVLALGGKWKDKK